MSGSRTILITGCSSGIGYTCAHGMAERGWQVFATARNKDDLERLSSEGLDVIALDYASSASIKACTDTVLERTGGQLFALFNNGAHGQPGAVEDLPTDILRAQFETNVFGWHDLTNRLVPSMRANGAGRIVQCSSVLGLVALKWRGAYSASKFALEALSDTMRMELDGSGIHVCQIEPGPIRTRFREHAIAHMRRNIDLKGSPHAPEYARQLALEDDKMARNGSAPPERPAEARAKAKRGILPKYKLGPDAVLDKLIHATESARPRTHYYVTASTWGMALARRVLTGRALDKLSSRVS